MRNNVVKLNPKNVETEKIVRLKKLIYNSNKLAMARQLPISFKASIVKKSVSGKWAAEMLTKFIEENPNDEKAKAVDLIKLSQLESVTAEMYELNQIIHVNELKDVYNQKQLDEYVSWLALNNHYVKRDHADLLEQKMKEVTLKN